MKLSDWCEAREISYRQLALWMGVHNATAWRWIQEKAIPSPERVAQIERITEGAVTLQDWYHTGASE